ncbi:hypothetical protein M514_01763 [Trichuris suis]|uniref:Eukaryotic translation initiation factor 2-alpha kinase 1 n=1 Tax=Trichuris suis TaxID=68888 RepID=A0A085NT45_9BILA|nr:hypothetical protein M514_01763 [Trichuris suis]
MSSTDNWVVLDRDGRLPDNLANVHLVDEKVETLLAKCSKKDLVGFWNVVQILDRIIDEEDRRFLARFSAKDFLGLLLVSLLKMVCCFFERNPDRQRMLFYGVSSFLTEVGIIPSSLLSDDLCSIHERFFLTLLRVMKATQEALKVKITPELGLLIPSTNIDEKSLAPFICNEAEWYNQKRWGMQCHELESVCNGHPANGAKVLNTRSDNQYAVKKVVLTSCDAETWLKELREVTILMKLKHPNVTQYYGAWIDFEEFEGESPFCGGWSSELNLHESCENEDSFIGAKPVSIRRSKSCPDILSVTAVAKVESNSTDGNDTPLEQQLKSDTICQTRYMPKFAHKQTFFCVYFRTETSPLTLKDWLSARNLRAQRGHGGFEAACYATEDLNFESWTAVTSSRTRKATALDITLYAAPELLELYDYDFTVDIFSIGIIVMELFCPYRTQEERIERITQLRNGDIPNDFYMRWPLYTSIAAQAVDQRPSQRPSTNDLLATGLFYSYSEEIMRVKDEISALEAERFEVLSRLDKCTCSRTRDK